MREDIVIVAAKRTPCGDLLGGLASLSAPELQAHAHRAALDAANLAPDAISEVITGCVLQAGIGQAPARQAAILAGIPNATGATTINKMCGSGMKSVMFGHDLIRSGSTRVVLAGGLESMSQAPFLNKTMRTGQRMGHTRLDDHMFLDGLEDAYDKGKLMGYFAEKTAERYGFSREAQDEFAITSLNRALTAQKDGMFAHEITPITVQMKKHEVTISHDEGPNDEKRNKIPRLKPAFANNGTVTAANASSISDGAASIIMMTAADASAQGLKPMARIVAHASHAQAPEWFTTAPVTAVQKLLKTCNWQIDEVDLFEINEAFAVVTMAAMHDLHISHDIVNVHGGACALGHPIGASGARIMVTLLHALKNQQKQKGVAAICIGGGEATAIAVEML